MHKFQIIRVFIFKMKSNKFVQLEKNNDSINNQFYEQELTMFLLIHQRFSKHNGDLD